MKNPGTLSLSKTLHDIYKLLDLDTAKEGDDVSNAMRSDHESDGENNSSYIKEHIVKLDNQPFDFVPISLSVNCCNEEHNRTEIIHGHVQVLILEQTN